MPFIELPLGWLFVIDACVWLLIHIGISYLTARIPSGWFNRRFLRFPTYRFEQRGELWKRLLFVNRWKGRIPDGTLFIRSGYDKRSLHGFHLTDLEDFAVESRRAELTHWLSILPAFLFFLWNPLWAGWLNIAYAILFNLPIILVQRYNRPRLEWLIMKKRSKSAAN